MIDFRELPGRADFWFLRHAESEGNRDGQMQGRQHSRLTAIGRTQARAAGRWLAGRGVTRLLASPLERAMETARIVGAEAGFPAPEPLALLEEIDIGIFTGLSIEQAAARHPAAHAAFQQSSWDAVDGAETAGRLYDRAMDLWRVLLARAAAGERSILCVTHSGFLSWIIKTTVGHRSWMPLFSASGNCCVSHLHVDNHDREGGRTLLAVWQLVNAPAGFIDGAAPLPVE
jgi:broad specificity phosphatase PhoE